MASKDNNIEYVIRAVDEFSKAMKDFQSYLKQTSDNSAKTEQSVKSLGDRLSGFGNIMTGFLRQLGVDIFETLKNGFQDLIGLIPQAYEQGYQWVSMVQQMQIETGLTAEMTSTYAAVMRVMGIDTDSTGVILARFGKNLTDSESKFKDLGIATRDSNGQMLDAQTVLENTRRRVAEIGPSFMSAAAAQDLFGRSGYKMLEFLNLTDEQFKALAQDAANAGLVLSQDTIDAAHRFGVEMGSLNNTITGVQTSIFAALEPSLEHFVDSFASFIQANLNNIVSFVVSVANFVVGVISGLFGIDMSAPTIAGMGTAGNPTGSGTTPTPAAKTAGGGGGSKANDAWVTQQQAQIKLIDDQITALQKLDTAQQALDSEATLKQAITDAQTQLTDLQGSVLNTYGLSDAERIKAEQKRAADVTKAEAKVVDTQKKYGDFQEQQARKAQMDQLQVIKQGLQDQLTAHKAAASAGAAAAKALTTDYLTMGDTLKTKMDDVKMGVQGFGTTINDFKTQTTDAIAQGKKFADWIKANLIPALQSAASALTTAVIPALQWFGSALAFLKSYGLDPMVAVVKWAASPVASLVASLGGVGAVATGVGWAFNSLLDVLKLIATPLKVMADMIRSLRDLINSLPKLPSFGIPKLFASGAIVDRPTLAMIGEGGEREAVIPESQWGSLGGRGIIQLVVDKRVLGQVVSEELMRQMPAVTRALVAAR